jgi:hypothetical protein
MLEDDRAQPRALDLLVGRVLRDADPRRRGLRLLGDRGVDGAADAVVGQRDAVADVGVVQHPGGVDLDPLLAERVGDVDEPLRLEAPADVPGRLDQLVE